MMLVCLNHNSPKFSLIKAKKLETLICQIWDCLPNFLAFNSSKLSEGFNSLIPYLEAMVNKNQFNLRGLALKSFSAIIHHCRHTPVVDE